MLIEFSGERTGSVLMFGNVASSLLKMMGQSDNNEGALNAEDVPAALEKLKTALNVMPEDDSSTEETEDKPVSLHNRAIPLIDLLEESIAKGGYVMWKPGK